MRWDIEVFFKCTKSLLRLQKEVQGQCFDSIISHTTIVFTRYITLAWQHRCSTDDRTIGGLFYELCDEVSELDWAIALQQLAGQWVAGLSRYIKDYLPNLCCES